MTTQHRLLLGVALVVGAVVAARSGVVSLDTAIILAVLVPSVILHEVSHGAVALAFGDDTAKRAGRLTLNPFAHVDPIGTVVLPVALAIATRGASTFGYAKPVPVNVRRLRHPRNHGLLVSLVGPAVNIALAVVGGLAFRTLGVPPWAEYEDFSTVEKLVFSFGGINVILATFNLLPIPPLDGSAMVERLLPIRFWPGYLKLRQYSVPFLLILVLGFPSVLNAVFDPAIDLWRQLLQ